MNSDLSHKPSTKSKNIGVSIEGSTIGGDVVAGNKIVTVLGSRAEARERRDQLILLEKVKTFWVNGVLEKSVHSEVLIELGKETRPEAVEHPWDMVLEAPDKQSQPIPSGKKIVEVFDDLGRALLILGAPGSGKTITLLELARGLIVRAESDPAQPIPVVFNLSSWVERRQPLIDWLADELNAKYHISRRLGRKWIVENDILPLLDGLDEVRADQREACVEVINKYQQEHGLPGLAVCSRVDDYAAIKAKLKLEGAILVQPLTDEQIAEYLGNVGGAKLHSLYKAMKSDVTLRELGQSPLMLSVMSISYVGGTLDNLPSSGLLTPDARRKYLFDAYVERMFARVTRTKNNVHPRARTIHWLSWLARGMKVHGQTVFLIEGLQPSWLNSKAGRWGYAMGSRMAGGLTLGVALSLVAINVGFGAQASVSIVDVSGPILVLMSLVVSVLIGATFGLVGGFMAGLTCGMRFEFNANRTGVQTTVSQNFGQQSLNVLVAGTGPGLGIGAFVFTAFVLLVKEGNDNLFTKLLTGFLIASLFALLFWFLFGFIFGLKNRGRHPANDISIESLRWSWGSAFKGTIGGLTAGLTLGSAVGVLFVLLAAMQAVSGPAQNLSWDRLLLTLIGVMCLCGGSLGLLGAGLFGLISGFRGRQEKIQTTPDEGIQQFARIAIFSAMLCGLSSLLASGAMRLVFETGSNDGLNTGLASLSYLTFLLGLIFAVVLGMYYGLAVIQHYTLRAILALTPRLPWNLVRFLDYCGDRIFLQKVGGGYIFIHRLLLEYFASLDADDIQRLAK
jgi:hypothetical protein